MNLIKCVPFVGTAISACECIGALARGDGKGALWKLGETLVDGVMDVTIIASGGLAAVVTTPGKIAGKTAGKAAVSVVAKAVAGRALVGALANSVADDKQDSFPSWSRSRRLSSNSDSDAESEELDDYTDRQSGKTQENKHQSSKAAQSSQQQKQSSASSSNNTSSTTYHSQDANYDSYYGSDDEDEEKRRANIVSGCAADLPRPRRQRRSSRLPRSGSIDEQCRPALPRADNVQNANQRIVDHMINYIESRCNDGLPKEAIDFIFETLLTSGPLNEFHQLYRDYSVVQVDEVFSGSSGDSEQWEINFTINIDGRSERQSAHVGYTIDRIRNVRDVSEPRENWTCFSARHIASHRETSTSVAKIIFDKGSRS